MPPARQFDVLEVRCAASLQATRRGRAEGIVLRVDRREPYAAGKAVVGEITEERRSGGHLSQAWQRVPDEVSRESPTRAAVRSAQRDEMAYAAGAIQLLDVVPSDQSTLRVAHEIDSVAPVFASELLHPFGHDGSQILYGPCVEAAEQPSKVDVMGAVSQPTESTGQPAHDARCGEEAMHEQHCPFAAVPR
jgi:hypothetical protein